MEQGGRADALALALEGGTASEPGIFEALNGGNVPVEQRRIGQRPEVSGGLQFRGVRRQKQQVGVLRFGAAKAALDLAVYPSREQRQLPNDAETGELVAWRQTVQPQVIVLEATGGYEAPVIAAVGWQCG